jgi:hypothetical protein
MPKDPPGPLAFGAFGGGGERATLVCGYLSFAHGSVHPLLSVLPTIVTVRGEGGRAHTWLESTLHFALPSLTQCAVSLQARQSVQRRCLQY